jgi:hypothetical protein
VATSSAVKPSARLSSVGAVVGVEIEGGAEVIVGETDAGEAHPNKNHRIKARPNICCNEFFFLITSPEIRLDIAEAVRR